VTTLLELARSIAAHRRLQLSHEIRLDQPATPMDATLKGLLERAVAQAGVPVHHLSSGAGHDAMIVARRMPVAMLFLRSPGGISHHPNEAVHESDVAAALAAGLLFLDLLAAERR
jgi:allantoate deiminase